jgi:hypothetical protein
LRGKIGQRGGSTAPRCARPGLQSAGPVCAEKSPAVDKLARAAVCKVRGNKVTTITGRRTEPRRTVVPILASGVYFDSESKTYSACPQAVHSVANRTRGVKSHITPAARIPARAVQLDGHRLRRNLADRQMDCDGTQGRYSCPKDRLRLGAHGPI